jgi:U3 small nucleolar RNA-associated protein 12
MLNYEISLGFISNAIDSLFLPGINSPSIIILSQINALIVWNLKSGSPMATLKKSSNIFRKIIILKTIKYKKNNSILIACGFDCGIIQIWNMNVFDSIINCTILKGHENFLTELIFCHKRLILASGCNIGDIVLWHILKKKGIFRIKFAHNGKINSICFMGGEKIYSDFILTCGIDNFLKFWKINRASCFKIINLPFYNIINLNFFFESKFLIFSNESKKIPIYQISNLLNFSLIGNLYKSHRLKKSYLKFDSHKKFLTIYGKNDSIEIFIFKKNSNHFLIHKEKISKKTLISDLFFNSFLFSFHSKIVCIDFWFDKICKNIVIFVHFFSHRIELYKLVIFKENKINKINISFIKIYQTKIEANQSDIREVIWLSNDFFLAALCGTARKINIWYLNTQKCKQIIQLESIGLSMILCGEKTILIGDKKGQLEMFDIFSGELLFSKSKAHFGPIWALDIIKNYFFLASGGSDGVLKFWEIDSSEIFLLKFLQYEEQILGLKFICKKNLIIINAVSSKLTAFFIDNLQFSFSLYGHNLPIMALSIRDDEFFLASGSADLSLRIWDLRKRKNEKIINYHTSAVTAVTFQKNNGNIFTGTRSGKICFWKEKYYILICELENFHQGPIWTLQCSNNGNFLASGSQDKSLKIWKIEKFLKYKKYFNFDYEKKKTSKILPIFLDKQKNSKKKIIYTSLNDSDYENNKNSNKNESTCKILTFINYLKKKNIKNILKSEYGIKIFNQFYESLNYKKNNYLHDVWSSIEKINWIFKFYHFRDPPEIFFKIEKKKKNILNNIEKKILFNLKVLNYFSSF